jgi:hypothetical protein
LIERRSPAGRLLFSQHGHGVSKKEGSIDEVARIFFSAKFVEAGQMNSFLVNFESVMNEIDCSLQGSRRVLVSASNQTLGGTQNVNPRVAGANLEFRRNKTCRGRFGYRIAL